MVDSRNPFRHINNIQLPRSPKGSLKQYLFKITAPALVSVNAQRSDSPCHVAGINGRYSTNRFNLVCIQIK